MKSNFQKSWDDPPSEHEDLDRALDAALAKYSAVEPRTGFEQRILAKLRLEQNTIPTRSWWRWGAVGAAAALIVIITTLGWKSSRPAKTVVQQLSTPIETVQPSANRSLASTAIAPMHPLSARRTSKRIPRPLRKALIVADEPRLDQFPSPEPLTEEELALVRYVREFRQDAVMVASAQEAFEKEVLREETAGRRGGSNSIEEER